MTSKAIIFSSISGSGPQLKNYETFKSTFLLKCGSADDFKKAPTNIGKVDYLLVTGGHGDFQSGRPTTFNDVSIEVARDWIAKATGETKTIILDFCFSTAVAPSLLRLLPEGGCVICAHGVAEGWFATVDPVNDAARTVGDVISTASKNVTSLTGVFSSASVMVKTKAAPILFTAVGGKDRHAGLEARRKILDTNEMDDEIDQLDRYVKGKGVDIQIKKPAEIAEMIAHSLPMSLM